MRIKTDVIEIGTNIHACGILDIYCTVAFPDIEVRQSENRAVKRWRTKPTPHCEETECIGELGEAGCGSSVIIQIGTVSWADDSD